MFEAARRRGQGIVVANSFRLPGDVPGKHGDRRDVHRFVGEPGPKAGPPALWHSHDEMYFGDSVSCLGIQLADLCTYFMQRHLAKRDKTHRDKADEFFNLIRPHAICAKPEPEWSQYREFLVSHDDKQGERAVQSDGDAKSKGQIA